MNRPDLRLRFFRSINELVVLVALGAAVAPESAHAQRTLVVDADGQAVATDCGAATPAFSTIQAAVNAAAPGDTIFVCPGTYNEQVVVTKNNLTILGAGAGATVLRPGVVAATTTSLVTRIPVNVAAILLVDGATGVTVRELTVDGSAHDSGAANLNCGFIDHFDGIFYRNGSGTVDRVHVTGIRSGTVCAFGIRGESSRTGAANLIYSGNLVDNYGTAGMVCAGLNTACEITGNTVTGRGPVDDQTQAGVAIRFGALAAISGNTIRDNYFIPHHLPPGTPAGGVGAIAVGIFLVYADPASNPHLLRDNTFANNELNVQRVSTREVID